ncbi:hypothetical protein Taro_023607 [Colocasia esculenta]|uniref:Pyrroline-5-carboxylate reductase n=1 Tax=Colocasia esculenta TaxID=4460 RepID=A0A843VBZ1_COLES|nr:hypothetical protein [Colocasia esculenta]
MAQAFRVSRQFKKTLTLVPTTSSSLLPRRPQVGSSRQMAAPATPLPDGLRLGFIGAGKMAESIARGVSESGVLPPSSICTAIHHSADRGEVFRSLGVRILEKNSQVVDGSDIIVLSVKPQVAKNVLLEMNPFFSEGKILVSIAAGIRLKDLQEWSGHSRLIRVMPNTPSTVRHAASVMCLSEQATETDGEWVTRLFNAIGKMWTTDEKYFDAVTGLSGSGPAYVYLAIEALADGGVAAGLPRDLALNLASQTHRSLQQQQRRHRFHASVKPESSSGDAVVGHTAGRVGLASRQWTNREMQRTNIVDMFPVRRAPTFSTTLERPAWTEGKEQWRVRTSKSMRAARPTLRQMTTLLLGVTISGVCERERERAEVLGAASMVNCTGKHPGQLKDDVTSPGGTTIAGIHELEKGGFRGILMNAVVAAANRSRELSM